jgi:hypothetical protein
VAGTTRTRTGDTLQVCLPLSPPSPRFDLILTLSCLLTGFGDEGRRRPRAIPTQPSSEEEEEEEEEHPLSGADDGQYTPDEDGTGRAHDRRLSRPVGDDYGDDYGGGYQTVAPYSNSKGEPLLILLSASL